ncbi:hypothetical protein ACWDTM_30880, partial [Nocardia beijingensis]
MTAPVLVAMIPVFAAGFGLDRLGHAARTGHRAAAAEARPAVVADNEQLSPQPHTATDKVADNERLSPQPHTATDKVAHNERLSPQPHTATDKVAHNERLSRQPHSAADK